MLWFLLKYWEMVEIGPKDWFFWIILRVFCLHPPTLCELRPKMKDLIQIYIYGKFLQKSICDCGCEVKIFLSFSYWFSIHEMAPFSGRRGGRWGSSPYSHLLSGCQVSSSGYLLFSTLPRRNNNVYFGLGPNWPILEGLGKITPVNNVRLSWNFDHR